VLKFEIQLVKWIFNFCIL